MQQLKRRLIKISQSTILIRLIFILPIIGGLVIVYSDGQLTILAHYFLLIIKIFCLSIIILGMLGFFLKLCDKNSQ